MSLPAEFLASADAEMQAIFNQAEDYYDGSGARFLATINAYLLRIAIFPEIAPLYRKQIR